ncbi:MAG: alpha-L-fucosidase [Planctomycetes bacterium]|nr:alpha-L-fucosidase [Planctomycetota bacterium]
MHGTVTPQLDDILKAKGDTSWFTRDRLGMFIHWGLYSLPGRHEWVQHNEKIAPADYRERYFGRFDPDLYDPELWAKAAAGAGMKYVVATAKHHEGFCLWDSKLTDYTAVHSPARRDLIRPLVEAFRGHGLRTGLYYSLLDWHHPHYRIDPHIGPLREHPDREALNRGRDQGTYAAYMRGQVSELLTGYGDIDVMWFDFSYPKPDGSGKGKDDWESDRLLETVRTLRPSVILDDRLDVPYGWDIKTPEQFQPRSGVVVDGKPVVWEACQTFSGSWGYHRDESSWKSVEQIVRMLVDTVSKDGNLLLNVGPTSRGEFDRRAIERLEGLGAWMRRHGRSIYGCGPAPAGLNAPQDCRYTYDAERNRLYLHLFTWPFRHIELHGLRDRVAYAQLLDDGSEIPFKGLDDWEVKELPHLRDLLQLSLPVEKPPVTVPVIELFLK